MRAIQVTRLDGPQAVALVDTPVPGAGDDQVIIDVAAAGVCFPDVLLTRGQYQIQPPLPFVPGCEVAGTVLAAPAGSGLSVGDPVAAFPGFGGFAEQVAAARPFVFPLPEGVPFEVGAALPMNYFTVHFALLTRAGLRAGDRVLVHGAAGGIGTAAIQLAKALGATVYAVVSSDAKGEVALAAGADALVPAEGFLVCVRDLTDGRGVDIVLDPVGGDRFTDSLRALAPLGRLLVVGFTAGAIPQVRVNRLLLNNVSVVGVGWGAYWMGAGGAGFLQEQWSQLAPLVASGALDPVIGARFPLAEAGRAIETLERREALGKVLLTL